MAVAVVAVVVFIAYRAVSKYDPLSGAFATAAGDSNPAWAPDGKRIVFQRDVAGAANQIYVIDTAGGDAQRLVAGNLTDDQDPAWSRDGKHIVFVRFDQLYVARADGSDLRPVTPDSVLACCPAWSPDGEYVAFERLLGAGEGDLYTIRRDGSGLRRLTRSPGFEVSPAWSPDGKTIAYDARGGVHLVDVDDGRSRRLTTIGREPAWEPTGKRLVMSTSSMVGGGLSVIDLRGNVVASLVPDRIAQNPAWSPDGRHIVFDGGGAGSLSIVSSDGSDVRQLTDG